MKKFFCFLIVIICILFNAGCSTNKTKCECTLQVKRICMRYSNSYNFQLPANRELVSVNTYSEPDASGYANILITYIDHICDWSK